MFVELETTLLRTNAPALDGNRATILDVDFSKLLNGPAFENTVATPSPLSLQELLWQLGDTPGVLTPDEREVFLEFEPPTQSTPPPSQPPARPAAPDTEIFLAPLTISGQHITIGNPSTSRTARATTISRRSRPTDSASSSLLPVAGRKRTSIVTISRARASLRSRTRLKASTHQR